LDILRDASEPPRLTPVVIIALRRVCGTRAPGPCLVTSSMGRQTHTRLQRSKPSGVGVESQSSGGTRGRGGMGPDAGDLDMRASWTLLGGLSITHILIELSID